MTTLPANIALPDHIVLPALPAPQELTLPGGAALRHLEVIEVMAPALTPLMPLFNILDAVLATFKCIEAIPDSLGPPPDPTKLARVLPELAEKIGALVRLIPQLSLPYTIVGIVDVVLGALTSARDRLVTLAARKMAMQASVQRAEALGETGGAVLRAWLDAADANLQQEAANMATRLGALSQLLGVLNVFLGLLGLPEAPDFASLDGATLETAMEPIDELVTLLQQVRQAVPLP